MEANTYSAAGVNIEKAERFVDRLKSKARRAEHAGLWKAAGGYAAVVPIANDLGMALTTDGVGTKLLLAIELNKLDTIGIDLVAMCANDLICVGATPTSFLDYFATPKLDDAQADAIIEGIVEGCDQAGMLLVGGETAELPGLYAEKHFDLAGFAAGTVSKQSLITGEGITAGNIVIGVASSGIHSNGFSLARKIIESGDPLREELLKPTSIYVKPVLEILANFRHNVKGMVHITGGGWRNMLRLNDAVGFEIDNPLPLSAVFEKLLEKVEPIEMYKTFNMGLGFMLIASAHDAQIIQIFRERGFNAQVIGTVTDAAGTVKVHAEKHLGTRNLGQGKTFTQTLILNA